MSQAYKKGLNTGVKFQLSPSNNAVDTTSSHQIINSLTVTLQQREAAVSPDCICVLEVGAMQRQLACSSPSQAIPFYSRHKDVDTVKQI